MGLAATLALTRLLLTWPDRLDEVVANAPGAHRTDTHCGRGDGSGVHRARGRDRWVDRRAGGQAGETVHLALDAHVEPFLPQIAVLEGNALRFGDTAGRGLAHHR